jgi:Ubiquitin elongating factor core
VLVFTFSNPNCRSFAVAGALQIFLTSTSQSKKTRVWRLSFSIDTRRYGIVDDIIQQKLLSKSFSGVVLEYVIYLTVYYVPILIMWFRYSFRREQLFRTHKMVDQLAPALVNVFVTIEMTGQGVQFEYKFKYRQPMYLALRYVWQIEHHREALKVSTSTVLF